MSLDIGRSPSKTSIFDNRLPVHTCIVARRLSLGDLNDVLELRAEVFSKLENPDFIHPEEHDVEFIKDHLGRLGSSVGVFHGKTLIAFASIAFPLRAQVGCCWLNDEGWKITEDVGIFQNSMVLKSYEGRGLQKFLISWRLKEADNALKTTIWALTSIGNYRSWGNFLKFGFRVKGIIRFEDPIFGSLERFGLDYLPNCRLEPNSECLTPINEVDQISYYLNQGYIGTERIKSGNSVHLKMMRISCRPCEDAVTL